MGRVRAEPRAREESGPEAQQVRQPSDQALLERYAARGDEEAFAILVERHGRTVWGVCRRLLGQEQDAEDAFQAVFVVLARKAASIRNGEAVGSWLYGVAYRTAMRARHSAGRRQDHERQAGAQSRRADPAQQLEPSGEAACREMQRLLDEEVQRLGHKYQAPFVLCCLEGMSKSEAAQELGWKEGTVSGRLARARKILQGRLTRRGVTLTAVLTALAVADHATPAPAALLRIAATGAPLAGKSVACPISPTALELAEAVLRSFKTPGLKVGLLLFLGLLLLIGGATLAGIQLLSDTVDPDLFVGPPVGLGTPVDEQVLAVAFTPDGRRLLAAGGSASRPGQVQVWEVASKKCVSTLRPLPGVRSLAFAPDGRTYATADYDGEVKIRDAGTGEERAVVHGHEHGADCVAFAPDGMALLSAGRDRIVKLWQANGLAEQRVFLGHNDAVSSGAFFHTAAALVSGSEDGTAIIWDRNTGQPKRTLRGHRRAVEAVAVAPDDKTLASAGRDGTVRLWSAETGAEQAVLDHEGMAVHAVAYSRDGKLLGTAAADGKVRLWDVKAQQLRGVVGQHKSAARAVAFSPNGSFLASGSSDQTTKLWPLGSGNQPVTLLGRSELVQPILALAYAPGGNVIAMATTEPAVQIRDATSGDVLRVLKGHMSQVNCLAFSSRGGVLASGSADRTVRLWDADTGQAILTLQQDSEVFALTFTGDGKTLACAGSDGVLRLWNVASGKELKKFPAQAAAIHAMAASPDGKTLVTGSADGTHTIWDLTGVNEPVTVKSHPGTVRALAFSVTGILASAGDDSLIKLWDPALDRERVTMPGHDDAIMALAFTPSGRTLVSGSRDQTVRVWDGSTGELRTVLRGHKKDVTTLAIHPHGQNLVTGSLDTMALRWRGTTRAAEAQARAKAAQ
jgi:RNA polymerase sigma factor (sigma-70 family)